MQPRRAIRVCSKCGSSFGDESQFVAHCVEASHFDSSISSTSDIAQTLPLHPRPKLRRIAPTPPSREQLRNTLIPLLPTKLPTRTCNRKPAATTRSISLSQRVRSRPMVDIWNIQPLLCPTQLSAPERNGLARWGKRPSELKEIGQQTDLSVPLQTGVTLVRSDADPQSGFENLQPRILKDVAVQAGTGRKRVRHSTGTNPRTTNSGHSVHTQTGAAQRRQRSEKFCQATDSTASTAVAKSTGEKGRRSRPSPRGSNPKNANPQQVECQTFTSLLTSGTQTALGSRNRPHQPSTENTLQGSSEMQPAACETLSHLSVGTHTETDEATAIYMKEALIQSFGSVPLPLADGSPKEKPVMMSASAALLSAPSLVCSDVVFSESDVAVHDAFASIETQTLEELDFGCVAETQTLFNQSMETQTGFDQSCETQTYDFDFGSGVFPGDDDFMTSSTTQTVGAFVRELETQTCADLFSIELAPLLSTTETQVSAVEIDTDKIGG